jgi:hypothetical protein
MESIETRLTAEDRPRRDHHDDRVARRRAARSRRAGALSYAGSLSLATGTAMIIWLRRAFQAAGTPIRPFTESAVLPRPLSLEPQPPCTSARSSSQPASPSSSGLSPRCSSSSSSSRSCRKVSSAAKRGCWRTPSATATGHTGARSDDGCRSGALQSTSSLALRRKRGSKEIGGG